MNGLMRWMAARRAARPAACPYIYVAYPNSPSLGVFQAYTMRFLGFIWPDAADTQCWNSTNAPEGRYPNKLAASNSLLGQMEKARAAV